MNEVERRGHTGWHDLCLLVFFLPTTRNVSRDAASTQFTKDLGPIFLTTYLRTIGPSVDARLCDDDT